MCLTKLLNYKYWIALIGIKRHMYDIKDVKYKCAQNKIFL